MGILNKALRKGQKVNFLKIGVGMVGCFGVVALATAKGGTGTNIGDVASSITDTFYSITDLITAGSYLAGLGFSIGAIMKFKAHKDNPTQITIGTPVALVFIAAAFLFLPSILGVAGYTMFSKGGGKTSGPGGSIFSASGE